MILSEEAWLATRRAVLARFPGIRSCALCGSWGSELCHHHGEAASRMYPDGWSASNRIMCDFFHRGIVPTKMLITEQWDEGGMEPT